MENFIFENTNAVKLDEYEAFLNKFKTKKTTDDCYTPKEVYSVILDYVNEKITPLKGKKIVRPFYPNGDYKKHSESYDNNTIVIDNPPFSILSEIKEFYKKNNIKFFLFCPHLTAFNNSEDLCVIITASKITYNNGAVVATDFVTNLINDLAIKGDHELHDKIKATQNKIQGKKRIKHKYPANVVLSTTIEKLVIKGRDVEIKKEDAFLVRQLDMQKRRKKKLFGSGFLVTDKVAKEIKEKILQVKEQQASQIMQWKLSERERNIVEKRKTPEQTLF